MESLNHNDDRFSSKLDRTGNDYLKNPLVNQRTKENLSRQAVVESTVCSRGKGGGHERETASRQKRTTESCSSGRAKCGAEASSDIPNYKNKACRGTRKSIYPRTHEMSSLASCSTGRHENKVKCRSDSVETKAGPQSFETETKRQSESFEAKAKRQLRIFENKAKLLSQGFETKTDRINNNTKTHFVASSNPETKATETKANCYPTTCATKSKKLSKRASLHTENIAISHPGKLDLSNNNNSQMLKPPTHGRKQSNPRPPASDPEQEPSSSKTISGTTALNTGPASISGTSKDIDSSVLSGISGDNRSSSVSRASPDTRSSIGSRSSHGSHRSRSSRGSLGIASQLVVGISTGEKDLDNVQHSRSSILSWNAQSNFSLLSKGTLQTQNVYTAISTEPTPEEIAEQENLLRRPMPSSAMMSVKRFHENGPYMAVLKTPQMYDSDRAMQLMRDVHVKQLGGIETSLKVESKKAESRRNQISRISTARRFVPGIPRLLMLSSLPPVACTPLMPKHQVYGRAPNSQLVAIFEDLSPRQPLSHPSNKIPWISYNPSTSETARRLKHLSPKSQPRDSGQLAPAEHFNGSARNSRRSTIQGLNATRREDFKSTKVKITTSYLDHQGISDYASRTDQFNSLCPVIVPVVQTASEKGTTPSSADIVKLKEHQMEMEKKRRLTLAPETGHQAGVDTAAMARIHFAQDTHRAFSTVRIPTARRSPAHLSISGRCLFSRPIRKSVEKGSPRSHRKKSPVFCFDRTDAVRIDKANDPNDPRFYPWAPYNPGKVNATCRYMLAEARGPPPAHRFRCCPCTSQASESKPGISITFGTGILK